VAGAVFLLLRRRCTRGGRNDARIARTLIGLLGAFALVGAASIGIFVAPIVGLLALAAALTPEPG
jgi:hypothetical protein